MSEAAPEGGNDSGETPAAESEFKAITSQDDLNRVIDDRLKRERAKYADYKDLKARAAKADEYEQANQTEAEKAAKRIADLETELTTTRAQSMRLRIATEHGITEADDIDLFLTGTDEETPTRQAKRLAARETDRKKNGNHVPREGNNPSAAGNDTREVLDGLFGGG